MFKDRDRDRDRDKDIEKGPRRRRSCRFCTDKNAKVEYKDVELLGHYITERGKILPRRMAGNCAKHQRAMAVAIRRARILALLPHVVVTA
jgi:small subunit ribosomal protein S18